MDHNLCSFYIHKAIKSDLGYLYRPRGVKNQLTETDKNGQVTKGKTILNPLQSESIHLQLFSDKHIFIPNSSFNRKNDCWSSMDTDKVQPFKSSKKQAFMSTFISTQGHVNPTYFFEAGQTIYKQVHIKVMEELVISWLEELA